MGKTRKDIVRIPVNHKDWFVVVQLFSTLKALQKCVKNKYVAGMYRPNVYVEYPKRKIYRKLGTIYLTKERLGIGIITHEVFHCTMDYAAKLYNIQSIRTDNDERQEEIAYTHGFIAKGIVNWLNDNNLWK